IVLSDSEGRELGLIRDIAELEPASRAVLEKALAEVYVIHRITRILEVEREPLTGQIQWRVEIAVDESAAPDAAAADAINIAQLAAGSATANPVSAHDGHPAEEEQKDPEGNLLSKVSVLLHLPLATDKAEPVPEEQAGSVATAERTFEINGHEDVQTARYPHIYLVDTQGNRYEIVDCEALDIESRRAAERFF
ncbi:MAG: DUF1854 domain-containing protein, partial [Armatimonadota bacterium]|nr:DUF1854 domain-containing protein [Armatimonadota bacterium]